jgi:hypothetical protein
MFSFGTRWSALMGSDKHKNRWISIWVVSIALSVAFE